MAPDTLAPERYKVQFTATAEYVRLVDQAKALLSHAHPQSTLEDIHLRAMRALVSELTKKKYASKTEAVPREPLATPTHPHDTCSVPQKARVVPPAPRQRGRHIPAAVRRAVFERDTNRCACVAVTGERCTEADRLEFHHVTPFAAGGEHCASNLTLRCAAHNALAAEEDFGREFVEERKRGGVHDPFRNRAP